MYRKLLWIILLIMSTNLFAQKPVVVDLWPNGAPTENGVTAPEEVFSMKRIRNVSKAQLLIYPASNPNGLCVVICPGGGYAILAMGHEGNDLAPWFNQQGITVAVLKYRLPNGHHEIPLNDAQEAIRYMRKHASDWQIKQVGIMGASAGSHLASTAATHFDQTCRPDFQILLYPVISFQEGTTHQGTLTNLLGKNPKKSLLDYYSNELQVNAQTPQAFIVHCTDDSVVPVKNSLLYYEALQKNKVSATLHLYPRGGHGWGCWDKFPYKKQWMGELEKWLKEEVLEKF